MDDPADSKPADWDESAPKFIPVCAPAAATLPAHRRQDLEATKPDDWDESAPVRISDPEAFVPEV